MDTSRSNLSNSKGIFVTLLRCYVCENQKVGCCNYIELVSSVIVRDEMVQNVEI